MGKDPVAATRSGKRAAGRPFKPGQSGNPKGRRPGIKDRRLVAKNLRELLERKGWSDEGLEEALRAQVENDKRGHTIRWLLEMLYGKPRQRVDLAGGVEVTKVIRDVGGGDPDADVR